MTIPDRPDALKDDTPLPFSAWRVMNIVDGKLSTQQIALELGMSQEAVMAAINQSKTWVDRAEQRDQVISSVMIDSVTQCLVSVLGPMGEVIVDDALEDAGKSATLSRVLSEIAGQLEEGHLHAFVRQLRFKGLA